ncbi:MAG TPA: FkbM family methyltransferase [Solirubrobacteraceae bacterium]|jgi:hypothetical protein|nr:FkbM family methyltransferase [Solirubrobacteraceae bacterium]
MSIAGRTLRATVLRPGRVWRVPWGIARGLRFEVQARAPLHTYLGTAEIELAGSIRELARPGTRCFDVGGDSAYYALLLARLTGAGVVSFEFDPGAIARMERNLALNPELAGRVEIVPAYVAHERVASPRAETLDVLIAEGEVFEPDLLKIDVEGAEAGVLAGARELLRSRRPHVIIETHSRALEEECLRSLREAGYETPRIIDPRRWLPERRGEGHNRWIVAPGAPARESGPGAPGDARSTGGIGAPAG